MKNKIVQIYTGDGKGKTTAAIGQALRAAGNGYKVEIVQFLKGTPSGEIKIIADKIENIKISNYNSQNKFIWDMNDSEKTLFKADSRKGWDYVNAVLENNTCDMVILDELLGAITNGHISVEEVLNLISTSKIDIVITGRNADVRLIEAADLVTEMKMIKHPFEKGNEARVGIEY